MGKRLIIGLGTGRCGTRSLAHWLNSQPQACVTHERERLPWRVDEERMGRVIDALRADPFTWAGDVAFYWLPYVPHLLRGSEADSFRFICLQRKREATLQSYRWKWGHMGICPLRETAGHPSPWNECYPTYPADWTTEQALGAYYDSYYARAHFLQAAFPGQFRLFATEQVLNEAAEQETLLAWMGFPAEEWVRQVGVYLNATPTGQQYISAP